MKRKEILKAFKEGDLLAVEVIEKLHKLKQQPLKNPLSEGQKGLWILQKMSPGMSSYNIPLCFRILEKLDVDKFRQACCFVLEQHPILSSVIREDSNGVPYQIVQPSQPLVFQQEDISNLESSEMLSYLMKRTKEPFSLENGSLMRVHLLSRSENEYIVLINIHHIVFDGTSSITLIRTLLDAYQDLIQERKPVPKPSPTSYYDFVEWEHKMLIGKEGEAHRSYWRQQLSGSLPTLEIPTDRPRLSSHCNRGKTYTNLLTPELSMRIKSFSQSYHLNLSIIFLSFFKVLLYRYTGQEDIIIGMPAIGRPQERFDDLIGYFINMIPIRSQVEGTKLFSKFIRELQVTVVDGLDHAYPFSALVRDLNVPRIPMNSPVFQVAFLYQNFFQSKGLKKWQSKLPVEFVEGIHQEGEYEFGLEVFEQEEGFILHLKYNPDLFDLITITRMMGHYVKLAEEIINDPSLALREYALLPKEEQEIVLTNWNGTQVDYPSDKCFHELFENQAQKTPNAIAVVYEETSLTYRELDEKSTQLAVYLQKLGVTPDCLVGIYVERSLDMIVGLLAILKAGGAYVPLDPHYPIERLEYMLQDSNVSLILTQSELMDKISPIIESNIKAIVVDKEWHEIEHVVKGEKILKREVQSSHLAYVIYTSGSTGKPKGVMIPHKALINFLISMGNKPGLNSQDKLFAVTTYCFDIAGLELYLPLMYGAQCYICSAGKAKDAEKLKQEIQKIKPTIMQATPVMWTMLFRVGWRNEEKIKILCGGDALPERLKQYFIDTNSDVWNMFGPTETTIWSTVQHVKKEEPITIGKPIANTQIYILDNNRKPVPIGIPGELCIAGDGLARGYLNKPELTAEKFITNPFNPGTMLYKTGDLARWLADGNIEFLGRNDHQVKIRGFRIELGEIESQFRNHPEVQDGVVIVNEQEGMKQLVAYYTRVNQGRDKGSLSSKELREHLKLNLPEHMIPALFIQLESIPLTPNGKIDRKELVNRKVVSTRIPKASIPQSENEERILLIWKEVLQNDDIGIEDGFFEVGGDSLLAVIVAERIKKNLDCDFNVTTLFKYSNIKDISKYIIETKDMIPVSCDEENIKEIIYSKTLQKESYPKYYQDSLAIIGISCQFPGAKDQFEFWKNLREGKESIKFYSQDELSSLNIPEEILQNPNYIPVQSAIEDKDLFDPGFFNISPKDANFMDPQFRLLLLHSWKAIEDTGYIPQQIPETSVFMTASSSFYQALLLNSPSKENNILISSDEYVSWILAQGGTIPTMISYKLGLKGPSFFVHSNCSSSLVALYSAYQSLQSGDARCALVGGASISPPSNLGYVYQPGLNFSSDGHIKTFDASADGMIGGEGVAVIVLKKAEDAIEDGDHIYALLRGIGVNNDGSDKVGFYAPSIKGQSEVIRKVLNSTQINPESISYMEAHGTGTKLGDPIEHTALSDVYKQYTTKKQFCGIGSVKTNIGHLDAAAGLAGCIKVALSLYHKEIPPSINFKKPNPNIDFGNSPFYIANKLQQLEKKSVPHRAALSSFGLGGTNAHAIFEQYISVKTLEKINRELYSDNVSYIIPISAKNDDRLKDYAQNVLRFLKEAAEADANFDIDLADLAYTFQVGRETMESRVIFTVNNIKELIQKLEAFIDGKETIEGCFRGEAKKGKDAVQLLKKDDDFKELIHKWIVKGKVKKLAELWSEGLEIEWELLYPDKKPKRISLPTYPFARERYGIFTQQEKKSLITEKESKVSALNFKNEDSQQSNSSDTLDYVVTSVQEILGLSSNCIIDPQMQLIEYGMDSISGIQLLEKLGRELEIKLDGSRFFSEFTLQEIISQIELANISTPNQDNPPLLPWEMDKKLPEELCLNKKVIPFQHNSSPEKVLLTGATGLLGAFLCHEILQQTSGTVYCLVRAESISLGLKRIQDNLKKYKLWKANYQARIIPILGDITKFQLGIEEMIYNELSQSIERVYHCAAIANHILNYSSLKNPNVTGTLSIIEFAANIKVKAIHFISTSVVCSQVSGDTILPAHHFEMLVDNGKNLSNGYIQTKWVSEHHLLQAQEQGIPITIFRCGQITGSSQTGYGIAEDMLHNFLKIFSEVEVIPQWDEGVMDIVPIDYVSQAILSVSQQNDCYGKIYHLKHLNPIPVKEFFQFLQKKKPVLSKVSFEEWADCCLLHIGDLPESSMKTILTGFFTKLDSGHRVFEYYFNNMGLSTENIQKALQKTEIHFPKMDEKWWEKCINQISLFSRNKNN